MKQIYQHIMIAIAAVSIIGCQKEMTSTEEADNQKKTIDLIVTATSSEDLSKSYIYPVPGGYKTSWEVGDCISLLELNNTNGWMDYYDSDPLEESDIVDGKASFKIQLTDHEQPETKFTYLAACPWGNGWVEPWENAEDQLYKDWAERFEYTGEYVEPHMIMELNFYEYQEPTAYSFDRYSDILVSRQVETVGQPEGEFELQFARLGTIVKITLDDLDEYVGMKLENARFSVGKSFSKPSFIYYDPVLEKYTHNNMMGDEVGGDPTRPRDFYTMPQDVYVKEDGTADLWLRTYAGELTDFFSLDIELSSDDDYISLKRYVDLEESGRHISFEEGKMTVFSVGGWGIADVESVYEWGYDINETRDGVTIIWRGVEHATGYKCSLTIVDLENEDPIPGIEMTPVDNGDGTWSATIESGLQKSWYQVIIEPIPEEGHELIDNEPYGFSLPLGISTYWLLSHSSFGDDYDTEYIEGTDNEYLIKLGPGKVRYKNLDNEWQQAWKALVSSGPWFMYSTEPLDKITKIELNSKNDSHLTFDVYASKTPYEKSVKLTGNVIQTSEINVGSGQYHYEAVHKLVEYVFPEDEDYQYFTIEGENAQTVMTSQESYIHYLKDHQELGE